MQAMLWSCQMADVILILNIGQMALSASLSAANVAVVCCHNDVCDVQAFSSWAACDGIEQCRRCCGGHGYSLLSGLPTLYTDYLPNATWEGDNNVLCLQVLLTALCLRQTSNCPSCLIILQFHKLLPLLLHSCKRLINCFRATQCLIVSAAI